MIPFRLFALTVAIFSIAGGLVIVFALSGPTPETGHDEVEALSITLPSPGTTEVQVDFEDSVMSGLVPPDLEEERALLASVASTTTTVAATTTLPAPTTTAASSGSTKPKPTTTTTQPPAPPTTVKAEFRPGDESEFLSLINGLRSSKGLGGLARNGSLDARARDWAQVMAAAGKLKHSNIANLLPPWSAAAENVGRGGSVSGIFSLLKGSSGHYQNMVGDYTHIGIGVWRDNQGTLWVVHVFTR